MLGIAVFILANLGSFCINIDVPRIPPFPVPFFHCGWLIPLAHNEELHEWSIKSKRFGLNYQKFYSVFAQFVENFNVFGPALMEICMNDALALKAAFGFSY